MSDFGFVVGIHVRGCRVFHYFAQIYYAGIIGAVLTKFLYRKGVTPLFMTKLYAQINIPNSFVVILFPTIFMILCRFNYAAKFTVFCKDLFVRKNQSAKSTKINLHEN